MNTSCSSFLTRVESLVLKARKKRVAMNDRPTVMCT